MIELIGFAVLLLGTGTNTENITCSSNCTSDPNNITESCNTTTGNCLYGCIEGFAGSNCTVQCPSACASPSLNYSDSETCNSTTLECFHGCNSSQFVGPTCSFKCPGMCIFPTDPKAGMCNITTGECSHGCVYGFGGPNCTVDCPSNCGISKEPYSQTCNETTEECLYGCLQGYGGPNCSTTCPMTCLRPASNNTETCDSAGNCKLGCIPGYAGQNCSFNCSATCNIPENSTETCNASTGECIHGCKDGFADIDCSFKCPEHCFTLESETCNHTSGECLHGCKKGFAGPDCSYECPGNCTYPSEDGRETCNMTDGECLNGCNEGFSGPNCSYPCPDACKLPNEDGEATCNYTNDECLLGCNNGSAGLDCSFECPDNCLFPGTNESGTCNVTSGVCLHGCKEGFVGPNCSIPCPNNCASGNRGEDMCDAATGECLLGCKDWFYGTNCTQACNSTINNCKRCSISETNSGVVCNECIRNFYRENEKKCIGCNYWCGKIPPNSNIATCRENDGYCNHGCAVGRLGFKCGVRCSSTCKGACHRDTGHCEGGCKYVSYCGQTCDLNCQNGCKAKKCNQTCDCVEGCTPTNWGEQCRTVCNLNCVKPDDPLERVCNTVDGACNLGCNDNEFWGNQCHKPCSNNCVNRTCEQYSGNCTNGCTTDTVYDLPCDKPCNENCIGGTCERADGYCKNGCKVGKYGTKCDMDCSENCFNATCTRDDGNCTFRCKDGYYGATCKTECSDRCLNPKCEWESGNCTDGCVSGYGGYHCRLVQPVETNPSTDDDDNNWIYVAIGCGALVLLGLMVTIVLITKKRRQIAKRRRTARMSTIPDEKVLEEAQRRHKHKTEGAGARLTQLFVENPLARFMNNRSRGGDLITKTPITGILKRVIQMDENDFSREFDGLKPELTKSHEASRRLDNLSHNLYNGIYPYDENRVVLMHSFEEQVTKRKSKAVRGILKSVHFGTFGNSNYDVMNMDSDHGKSNPQQQRAGGSRKNKGKDESNGYSSVVFNIKDETAEVVPTKADDEPGNDDYATVNASGNNTQTTDIDEPSDYAKVSLGNTADPDEIKLDDNYDHTTSFKTNETAGPSTSMTGGNDYAIVDKGNIGPAYDNGKIDGTGAKVDDKYDYAVVHKDRISMLSETDTKKENGGTVISANDYINASLIKGYNQNQKYIAAQGPSKGTVNNFWIMAWEQKCSFIIMLIEITEEGHTRCQKYWPDEGQEDTYGEITVTCYDAIHYVDYEIRFLRLSLKNGQMREIVHLQFTAWPDEGCPMSAIEFIQFHQKYRALTKGRLGAGPTIVHCTAGVGRTGVFIALDTLVEEGLDSLNVDVYKCVTSLRDQRVLMVHSIEQYEFLYKAVAQTFALEVQPCHKVRLQEKLTELKKFDHDSGKTKLELLHQNLKSSLVLDTVDIAAVDAIQERRNKDRPTSDVPDVPFRPDLPNNIYINAVIYDSLKKKEFLVATQMPTPDTLQDFCQLIVYHKCTTVIMLNHLDPNDKSLGVYWPTGKTPVVAGKMIVSQIDIEKESDYIVRQLRIHSPDDGEDSPANEVTMIQYKSWKIVKNLPNAKNMMKFLQLCQRHIKGTKDARILAHCLNGAEQSGLLCALLNLYEYVDTEDELSVPGVVRRILARRPNAIPTTEQFEMCFAATCEYIKKT